MNNAVQMSTLIKMWENINSKVQDSCRCQVSFIEMNIQVFGNWCIMELSRSIKKRNPEVGASFSYCCFCSVSLNAVVDFFCRFLKKWSKKNKDCEMRQKKKTSLFILHDWSSKLLSQQDKKGILPPAFLQAQTLWRGSLWGFLKIWTITKNLLR